MKPTPNYFVIVDPTKCVICRSCEVAFDASNRENTDNFTVENIEIPIAPRLFLVKDRKGSVRVQCGQCKDFPCANRINKI